MPYNSYLPFFEPDIEQDEIEAATNVLRSNWLTQGPRVSEFEAAFSDFLGGSTSIAVNSATAALHLSLLVLGIGPGDEVITTPFTFASTANVIELVGANCVFADIDDETLNIDAADIERKITPKTKAILAVHFAGLPCDLDSIRTLAQERNIAVIEDAAHAHGAIYKNKIIGSDSEFAAFSFYPNKNMTAIEGGMLVTNRSDLAQRIRILRWYGLSEAVWERIEEGKDVYSEVLEPGFKYNMNDVQAAVGLVQLGRLSMLNKKRRFLADTYINLLQDLPQIRPPIVQDTNRKSSCHVFVVRLAPTRHLNRNSLAASLNQRKISTSYHYRSLHLHPYYKLKYRLGAETLPIATKASDEVISLPLFPKMDVVDVERVVDAVRRSVAGR